MASRLCMVNFSKAERAEYKQQLVISTAGRNLDADSMNKISHCGRNDSFFRISRCQYTENTKFLSCLDIICLVSDKRLMAHLKRGRAAPLTSPRHQFSSALPRLPFAQPVPLPWLFPAPRAAARRSCVWVVCRRRPATEQ